MVTGGGAHGGIGRPQGGSGAGVYWQIMQPDDPDVLTMVLPEQVATDAAVPDVSLPEVVGQEAWTLDFDAVRAHLEWQSSSHFPACGPVARWAQRPPSWDHQCASTLRRR